MAPSLARWKQSYGPVRAAGDPVTDALDEARRQARSAAEVAVVVGVPALVFVTGVALAGYWLVSPRRR